MGLPGAVVSFFTYIAFSLLGPDVKSGPFAVAGQVSATKIRAKIDPLSTMSGWFSHFLVVITTSTTIGCILWGTYYFFFAYIHSTPCQLIYSSLLQECEVVARRNRFHRRGGIPWAGVLCSCGRGSRPRPNGTIYLRCPHVLLAGIKDGVFEHDSYIGGTQSLDSTSAFSEGMDRRLAQ